MTAQDVWAVKRLGAPALSPDGGRAVFGVQDDGHPALPFTLGDRGLFHDAGIAELFFGLLALGRSRLSGNEGLALLGHPLVMAHYDLTREDLERLRLWLAQSGVRWGLDA